MAEKKPAMRPQAGAGAFVLGSPERPWIVTTAEEANALPEGAVYVVVTAGGVPVTFQKVTGGALG